MTTPQPPGLTDLDHRYVEPPYLRVADTRPVPPGGCLVLWHFRLLQPNITPLPTDAMHSLEHFLIYELCRDPQVLLAAPMGCRTGLYLVSSFEDWGYMANLVAGALGVIVDATEVPGADEIHCGLAHDHALGAARRMARHLLLKRDEWSHTGSAPID